MKCLKPDCKKPASYRGLCNADYCIASRLVRDDKTTWDDLVKAGKALPVSTKRTSRNQQWFTTK